MKTFQTSRKDYFHKKTTKTRKSDTDPKLSEKGICTTFHAANIKHWYDILACRYFTNMDDGEYCLWNNVTEKGGLLLLETHLAIQSIFSGQSVSISLFHTTCNVRIQGKQMNEWMSQEYPGLLQIYLNIKSGNGNGEDIITQCTNTFEGRLDNFVLWSSSTSVDEKDMEKYVTEEIRRCLSDVIDLVVSNENTPVTMATSSNKCVKKTVTKKYVPDEGWVGNMTSTVNKLDERLCDLSVNIETIQSVHSLTAPLIQEVEASREKLLEVSLLKAQLEGLRRDEGLRCKAIADLRKNNSALKDELLATKESSLNYAQVIGSLRERFSFFFLYRFSFLEKT